MEGKEKIKAGIFGGSFNPIHIGHLVIANYMCEYCGLDEVWFLVTPQSPFKVQENLWDDAFRLKLVECAIGDYPRFRASDFEFHLPRPSYTVYTLEKLRMAYPGQDFHLIIGSDNWCEFGRWHQSDRIIQENRILIYPRPGYPVDESSLPDSVTLVHSPVIEISSTFIRQALAEGKDVRYFLHPKVWECIQEMLNGLPGSGA